MRFLDIEECRPFLKYDFSNGPKNGQYLASDGNTLEVVDWNALSFFEKAKLKLSGKLKLENVVHCLSQITKDQIPSDLRGEWCNQLSQVNRKVKSYNRNSSFRTPLQKVENQFKETVTLKIEYPSIPEKLTTPEIDFAEKEVKIRVKPLDTFAAVIKKLENKFEGYSAYIPSGHYLLKHPGQLDLLAGDKTTIVEWINKYSYTIEISFGDIDLPVYIENIKKQAKERGFKEGFEEGFRTGREADLFRSRRV